MPNSTEEEYVKIWLPVTITGIFILLVLLIQSFIVAVIVIDWLNGKSMKATDQIITSVWITRIFCLVSSLLHVFISLYPTQFDKIFCIFILFTWQTLEVSIICLSTLLSIFFAFTTFQSVLLLRLKAIISRRVVYLIIISFLLGFGYSCIYRLVVYIKFGHSSENYISEFEKNTQILSVFNWCNLFPLLVYFAFSVLLVVFLGFHVRRMRSYKNSKNSTATHHKAISFTVISFLTCAFCIIVNLTEQYGIKLFGIFLMYLIWNIFPVLHSPCLIYGTTKLKNQLYIFVCCGSDCLFKRKANDSKSGEGV